MVHERHEMETLSTQLAIGDHSSAELGYCLGCYMPLLWRHGNSISIESLKTLNRHVHLSIYQIDLHMHVTTCRSVKPSLYFSRQQSLTVSRLNDSRRQSSVCLHCSRKWATAVNSPRLSFSTFNNIELSMQSPAVAGTFHPISRPQQHLYCHGPCRHDFKSHIKKGNSWKSIGGKIERDCKHRPTSTLYPGIFRLIWYHVENVCAIYEAHI